MKSNIKSLNLKYSAVLFAVTIVTSCDEFIKVDPPQNEVVSATVFSGDASAQSAMSGIYSLMVATPGIANTALELYTGLSGDELINYSAASAADKQFYVNAITSLNDNINTKFWTESYKYIFNANAMIDGLDKSEGVSANVKKQLQGEARFIRAFCYFNLTNSFGDVPLVLTTDYRINSKLARASSMDVYSQIVEDLKIAQAQLPVNFSFISGERVRATKWAATALLARVYLYTNNWPAAEEQSTLVIDNSSLFSLITDPNSVFLKNSLETIWQLKPVVPNTNTTQATTFILDAAPTGSRTSLTDAFVNSFEVGDKRRTSWVGSIISGGKTYYYSFKYKKRTDPVLSEYLSVLRLSEQYLIRSEARAQQGNITGSLADLNKVRTRAGLAARATPDQATLLDFIYRERRVELFTEWGHRWFDLKRTGRASQVLQPIKSGWTDTDILYPIPITEINTNPALLPQNSGY